MDNFSLFNYENLSEEQKTVYNKALAQRLSSFLSEIKSDDVLGALAIDMFVASDGCGDRANALVGEVYPRITSGIQAGSGNQALFQGVLYAFVEAWKELSY